MKLSFKRALVLWASGVIVLTSNILAAQASIFKQFKQSPPEQAQSETVGPDEQAAQNRVETARAKLEQAHKQLDAAKIRLKAADAEFKAAKADEEALSLRNQAQKLSDASGLPNNLVPANSSIEPGQNVDNAGNNQANMLPQANMSPVNAPIPTNNAPGLRTNERINMNDAAAGDIP